MQWSAHAQNVEQESKEELQMQDIVSAVKERLKVFVLFSSYLCLCKSCTESIVFLYCFQSYFLENCIVNLVTLFLYSCALLCY